MIDPTRHHGLDIVRAVADEWGSTAITAPALSGRDSTAPSSCRRACAGAIRRPPYRRREDVTAARPPCRALSGLALQRQEHPKDHFEPLRRNDLQDPPLSAG